MPRRSTLIYIGQAVILGLAIAFVVTILWPSVISAPPAPHAIEIKQTTATGSTRPTRGEGPVSYAAAVESAAPAVVNINTAKVVTVRSHPFFDDPVFREFFGRSLDGLIAPRQQVQTSLGSGVIMSVAGYILTNHHVIDGADEITVALRDGRSASAKVVGSDPETDLAVLKIELSELPTITLGHSDQIRVGDVVLAIGNPFGVGQTVTMGIVSATGRNRLGINTFENFIQTDAAINPGNSGGALIDAYGNLIGINTAIFSRTGGSQGVGFAIPMDLAEAVLADIIRHGRPLRGWLGIEGEPVTPEIARNRKLAKTRGGIIVMGIYRGSPAHRAGIEPGDIIIAIDGKPVAGAYETLLAISAHRPGSEIHLTLIRNSQSMTISATVSERPVARPTTQ